MVGDTYDCTKSEFIEKLPEGKSSTRGKKIWEERNIDTCLGIGKYIPSTFEEFPCKEEEPLKIARGPPILNPEHSKRMDLHYNEYIVYDTSQVKIRYLVKGKEITDNDLVTIFVSAIWIFMIKFCYKAPN